MNRMTYVPDWLSRVKWQAVFEELERHGWVAAPDGYISTDMDATLFVQRNHRPEAGDVERCLRILATTPRPDPMHVAHVSGDPVVVLRRIVRWTCGHKRVDVNAAHCAVCAAFGRRTTA